MELNITHTHVSQLVEIENLLATLPRSADHAAFYKKQSRETQITDLLTLAASMEYPLSIEDAKEFIDAPDQKNLQQQRKFLKNCLAVMKYAKSLREHGFNTAVLQQINKLLAEGFSDFWEEGKVRAAHETPTYNNDGLRNRTTHPEYQLWTDIRQVLSYIDDKMHPLLLTGITAYHLAYSYPFLQANLQTALLSCYAILKPTRYWVSGTVSGMEIIWKTLQKTDFTFDPSSAHFTQFLEKLLREYVRQVETIHDALLHQSSIAPHIRASLNDRQFKILTYFKQHKKLSRKKYSSMMNVAIATAFRDLNDLNAKGLIKAVGRGRGTSYILAQLPTPGDLSNSEPEEIVPTMIVDTEYDF